LSRHGPDSPKAGIRIIRAFGLSSFTRSQPRPKFPITRGVKFSMIASHSPISRSASSRPFGLERSRVMPSLLLFACRKWTLASHHSG